MPGSFHILASDAKYEYSRGSQTATIKAVCGRTLTRYQDDYCNIAIANPNWDKDWCHDCVKCYRWPGDDVDIWRDLHGIELGPINVMTA